MKINLYQQCPIGFKWGYKHYRLHRKMKGSPWKMLVGRRSFWVSASQIEWDLTNGPLSKLLELFDTQVRGSIRNPHICNGVRLYIALFRPFPISYGANADSEYSSRSYIFDACHESSPSNPEHQSIALRWLRSSWWKLRPVVLAGKNSNPDRSIEIRQLIALFVECLIFTFSGNSLDSADCDSTLDVQVLPAR